MAKSRHESTGVPLDIQTLAASRASLTAKLIIAFAPGSCAIGDFSIEFQHKA